MIRSSPIVQPICFSTLSSRITKHYCSRIHTEIFIGAKKMFKFFIAWLLLFLPYASYATPPLHGHSPRILVFSRTLDFRHDSIPDGIAALKKLGIERGWQVDATEDAGQFTDSNLRKYDVVVWLNTSGKVLNPAQ